MKDQPPIKLQVRSCVYAYLGHRTQYRRPWSSKDCHSTTRYPLVYRNRLQKSAWEQETREPSFHTYQKVRLQRAARHKLQSPASDISQRDEHDHGPPGIQIPRRKPIEQALIKDQDRKLDRPDARPEEDDDAELDSKIAIRPFLKLAHTLLRRQKRFASGGQVEVENGRYDLTVQARHCDQRDERQQDERVRDEDVVDCRCLFGDEEADCEAGYDEGDGDGCDDPDGALPVGWC